MNKMQNICTMTSQTNKVGTKDDKNRRIKKNGEKDKNRKKVKK